MGRELALAARGTSVITILGLRPARGVRLSTGPGGPLPDTPPPPFAAPGLAFGLQTCQFKAPLEARSGHPGWIGAREDLSTFLSVLGMMRRRMASHA